MYLSYYNLNTEPFSISTDPKFLWLGEKHKEALAALKYGILGNKGFLLLTGDVGTGKTTLINALLNSLGNEILTATVQDPGLEALDFFNYIAAGFKLKKTFKSKGEFISYFSLLLRLAYDKSKKVLLIIDEAQRLSDDRLEELRLLSNIEKQHTKLINIFFVGQNEFNEILMKKENRALRQRMTLIHRLETLDSTETHKYIQHRLLVAGSTKDIFNSDAIEEIFAFSGGYPRLINIICDHALLTGYAKEKKVIGAEIIQECARELRIPIESYEKESLALPSPTGSQNPTVITEKRASRIMLRSVLLLTLLIVAAAAFYYNSGMDLPPSSIKNYRDRFVGAIMATKTESNFREEQIPVPDNNVATYHIPNDHKLNQQKTVNVELSYSPDLAKGVPGNPENGPAPEYVAQQPMTDNLPAVDKKKTIDKIDEAVSLNKKFNILFDYNSFDLSKDAIFELDKIIAILIQYPDMNVLISGFTDNFGKVSYNIKLSDSRAATVKNYLLGNGIKANKIKTFAMGPDRATDEEGNEKPNRMSRRVEIELK